MTSSRSRHPYFRPSRLLAVLVTSLLLAACGSPPQAPRAGSTPRVVEISMRAMTFTPQLLKVVAGQQVTFRFTNDSEVTHEAFLGRAEEQREHSDMMKDMVEETIGKSAGGDMGHSHDHGTAKMVVVEPGETREIMHTFDKTGEFQIGCHQPGHYESGMVLTLEVLV